MIPTPEFVEAPEKQLVAISDEFTLDSRDQIPALWNRFWSAGWDIPGTEEPACFGVSYNMHCDGRFSYAAGVHITPVPQELPEGACIVTLSEGCYAVFRNRGPIYEIPRIFDAISRDWWPASGKKQRPGAVFERYPYEEGSSIESAPYELWFPIER